MKIDEENEVSVESETTSKKKHVNTGEIEKRIEKLQMSNPYLKEQFGKIGTNMSQLGSYSKRDHFDSLKNEIPSKINEKTQTENPKNEYLDSRLPTMESLNPGIEENDQGIQSLNDLMTSMFHSTQMMAGTLPRPNTINHIDPHSRFLLETKLFEDLFTEGFKRYLQFCKPTIKKNLDKHFPGGIYQVPSSPASCLKSNSDSKRKNTDPMSSDTIESDINAQIFNRAPGHIGQISQKEKNRLSAFFQTPKKRTLSMNAGNDKEDSQSWDPREEKKQ